MGTHADSSTATYKRSVSTAPAGTHNLVDTDPHARTGPFPEPLALVLPLVKFGQSKPDGLGYIDTVDSDLMHHPLSFSGIQARRAGISPILLRRPVEGSMRLFFKKLVTMSRTSPISSLRILVTRTWLSYSTRTPLSLTRENSTSKITSTVTFFSVHIHNVVAKERDAFTDLLQRLHGYVKQPNVDFIRSDFNMSALSTVGDVLSDPEFSAPGNSLLWGLGALEEQNRECTGFLIMPKRPYEWRVDSHGCYKFDNAALGFGPRDQTAHLPVFLHLRTTNLPGPDSIMRSKHAQQRNTTKKIGTQASQT